MNCGWKDQTNESLCKINTRKFTFLSQFIASASLSMKLKENLHWEKMFFFKKNENNIVVTLSTLSKFYPKLIKYIGFNVFQV